MSIRKWKWIIFWTGIIVLVSVYVLIHFPGITLGGFLLLPFFVLLKIIDFFNPMCVYDSPILQLASPDRKMEALVWHRDCGVFSGVEFTTLIKRFGDQRDQGEWVFTADSTRICALYWQSPDHLVMELAYGTKFMGIRSTIPKSAIFENPDTPGAIEFELRKVPYSERCTLGMNMDITDEMAYEFLTTPGFPMYDNTPKPEKKKKKKTPPSSSTSISQTGSENSP